MCGSKRRRKGSFAAQLPNGEVAGLSRCETVSTLCRQSNTSRKQFFTGSQTRPLGRRR
jgi:hypothetical protein